MKIPSQIIQQGFEIKGAVLTKCDGSNVLGQIVIERKLVKAGPMQLQGSVFIDHALIEGEKYYRSENYEFCSENGDRIFLGRLA
jgi:hypothetical protein